MGVIIVLLVQLVSISASSPPPIIDVTDANVTITSPSFPNKYPPDSNTTWRFILFSPANFTIYLEYFSLEKSEGCKFDALEVWDRRDEILKDFFCGNLASHSRLVKYDLSYGFNVRFKSDSSVQWQGFAGHVTTETLSNDDLCYSMHDYEEKQIRSYIGEEKQKYPANLSCTWEISSPPDKQIVLRFEELNIEFSGPDCLYDHIEVWDMSGKDTSSAGKRLAKICGRHRPWSLFTNSTKVHITFSSDGLDNNGQFVTLYHFNATQLTKPRTIRHTEVTPVLQTEAIFTDGINRALRLLWKFRTHPGFSIQIHMMNLSSVCVNLYDGPDMSFNQIKINPFQTNVSSEGFHLILSADLTADNRCMQDNVTFASQYNGASHDVGPVRIYFDIEPVFVCSKTAGHFTYLNEAYLHWAPNIDNCAYGGLAMYAGDIKFDNLIGTLCNIHLGYLTSFLRHLVPSMYELNIIYYNYKWTDRIMLHFLFLLSRSSTCRGYILTEKSHKNPQVYKDENLMMTAAFADHKWNISIQYEELPSECVSVQVLSHFTSGKEIKLFLNGRFSYRICRQGGSQESLVNDSKTLSSKYDFSRRCSELTTVYNETTETVLPFNRGVWPMEYVQIELGTPPANVRKRVSLCSVPGEQMVQLKSGLNPFTYSISCPVRFLLPHGKSTNYKWLLSVRVFTTYTPSAILKISEENGNMVTNVSSEISITTSGHRSKEYVYYSMQDSDILLSSAHIDLFHIHVNVSKSIPLARREGNTPSKEKCILFDGSCYTFKRAVLATSWLSAQNICRDSGGELVSVNTVEELQFLKQALSSVWFEDFYGHNRGLIFIGLHNMIMGNDYRWVDGSPLTVTDWYYPFDEDNILHYSPSPPIDRENIQPVMDLSQRCVAMVPGNSFYSTNWRKIKCKESTYPSSVYAICEYNNTSSLKVNQSDTVRRNGSVKYRCDDGWNFVYNTCFIVLTKGESIVEGYESEQVDNMCAKYGGRLPKIIRTPKSQLQSFFLSKGFGYSISNIWVKLESDQKACISVFGNIDIIGSPSYKCGLGSESRWVAVCEKEPIHMNLDCLSYQFSCRDGTCLNPDRICDFNKDCSHGEDESHCNLPGYLYTCESGQKISAFKKCDFHADCFDGSDEALCIHMPCLDIQFECKNNQCISMDQRCDQKADCVDGSDEDDCEDECHGFRCPLAGCIVNSQIEDLQVDCPDKSEADEKVNILQHKRERVVNNTGCDVILDCPGKLDHLRCHRDHIKCYPADKACVYDHDVYGRLKYCSNGAHLRHCAEFECPDMFKCEKSYCIPYHKVCDGVQDCVKGEDETNCEAMACPGMLKCGSSNQCVSQDRICDMEVNCENDWSDEMFCDLKNYSCPFDCTCVGYYVDCREIRLQNVSDINIMKTVRILDVGKNNISFLSDRRPYLDYRYLTVLYLQHNTIQNFSSLDFSSLINLIYLDVSYNAIQFIPPDAFSGISRLQTLRMVGNPVHQLSEGCFRNLAFLSKLNLSGMLLEELGPHNFEHLSSLQSLDLSSNNIKQLSPDTFTSVPPLDALFIHDNSLDLSTPDALQNLNVGYLQVDSYRLCCVAGTKVRSCFPPVEDYSTCADLLPSSMVRVFVGVFAVLAILGNIFVISWRLYKRLPDVPSVLVFNLSVSDLLMGLYLLAISVTDLHYRRVYILHDVKWRTSVYCKLIGVIGSVSCEMSMYTLVLIAVDRTKKLAFPLSSGQFTVSHAWLIELVGWVVWTFLSVIPLMLPVYFGNYYGRNSICLPFNFADPTGPGWEMTTVVFVGFNSIGLIMISVMYAFIFFKVKQSLKKAGRRDHVEVDVARKLSIIILTDVACMLPIVVTNFMAVLGHPVERGMAAILATFMLPLNSALNPFLFTLNNLKLSTMNCSTKGKKRSSVVTRQSNL